MDQQQEGDGEDFVVQHQYRKGLEHVAERVQTHQLVHNVDLVVQLVSVLLLFETGEVDVEKEAQDEGEEHELHHEVDLVFVFQQHEHVKLHQNVMRVSEEDVDHQLAQDFLVNRAQVFLDQFDEERPDERVDLFHLKVRLQQPLVHEVRDFQQVNREDDQDVDFEELEVHYLVAFFRELPLV